MSRLLKLSIALLLNDDSSMKKYLLYFFGMIAWIMACQKPSQDLSASFKNHLLADIDSLNQDVALLLKTVEQNQGLGNMQKQFVKTRLQYKKIAFATSYFMPSTTRLVNGAPLNEIEIEENTINEPGGLQVIEGYLYPTFDMTTKQELVHEIRKLQTELKRYQNFSDLEITEAQIVDAIRLQVFRLMSLDLSGFDTPLCNSRLPEITHSLQGIQQYLQLFSTENKTINTVLEKAILYTQRQTSNSLNHLELLSNYLIPVSKSLLEWQQQNHISSLNDKRPLRSTAYSYFEKEAFFPDFYTYNTDLYTNLDKVALGKTLFFDTILSDNNQQSCASCHQPDKAFTDGMPQAMGLDKKPVKRNTPTLLYAGLQAKQFYDLSVNTLEEQAKTVIHNKSEMHGSLAKAVLKIQEQRVYLDLFKRAFPQQKTPNESQIQNALGAFVRSLAPFESPFDAYMRGQQNSLTAEQQQGFNVFMGKAKCGTCHFMPIFNGTVPPEFLQTESEVIGTFATPQSTKIDTDKGRGALNPQIADWHFAFKTPTLRNIAKTAPYMHNGQYPDLVSVIDFYNEGGAIGRGVDLPNQTLADTQLNLDPVEKKALIAFLHALNDK